MLGGGVNFRQLSRENLGKTNVRTSSTTVASTVNTDEAGRVRNIFRYPVKSCGGEELKEVMLSRLSPLPGDRQYLFVDSLGKFLTQRPVESRQGNDGNGVPKLATISASYSADGSTLRLEASDAPQQMEPLVIAAADAGEARREVTLFSGQAKVIDQASQASGEWFRQFCGVEGACLVKSDDEATTLSEDWRESRRNFQSAAFKGEETAPRAIPLDDGGTILLVSQASLDELNTRLAQKSLPPVSMSRFRPNFVLADLPAHAEDGWREVQLGEVRLKGAPVAGLPRPPSAAWTIECLACCSASRPPLADPELPYWLPPSSPSSLCGCLLFCCCRLRTALPHALPHRLPLSAPLSAPLSLCPQWRGRARGAVPCLSTRRGARATMSIGSPKCSRSIASARPTPSTTPLTCRAPSLASTARRSTRGR